jgi:hypothetical protein
MDVPQLSPAFLKIVRGQHLAMLILFHAVTACAIEAQPRTLELPPPDVQLGTGLSAVTSVRELADGRLLVADFIENRIGVVDWTTGAVTSIGSIGDGPGEYRYVGWLYPLSGDATLLTEPTRRWHILDRDGFSNTLPERGALQQLFGALLGGSEANGSIMGVLPYKWPADLAFRMGPEQAESLYVVIAGGIAGEWMSMDTVATIAGPGLEGACSPAARGGRPGGAATPGPTRCNPFAAAEQALLFPDGAIAIVRRQPYRVEWRDPRGAWTRGPILDRPPRITERDQCAVRSGFPYREPAECDQATLRSYEWPSALPPFVPVGRNNSGPYTAVLFAAPDGSLVIRRTPSSEQPGNRYDFVARDGSLAATLHLPANEAIVGFGRNATYTVRTDEVDLQWLRRHPWR